MWGTAKLQLMFGFLNPSQIFLPQRFAFQGRVRSKRRCSKQPRPGPLLGGGQSPRAGTACRQELSQGIPHWIIATEAWGWRLSSQEHAGSSQEHAGSSSPWALPWSLCSFTPTLNRPSVAGGARQRGGKGTRDSKGKEPVLVEAGQGAGRAGRAAGAQGCWAVFFARHLQRCSELFVQFPHCSFFPSRFWFPSPLWNIDRNVSFCGAGCMQTLLKFLDNLSSCFVLFCFVSNLPPTRRKDVVWPNEFFPVGLNCNRVFDSFPSSFEKRRKIPFKNEQQKF